MFEKVYDLMQSGSNDEDTLESQVENLIGSSKMYYFNYVRQVCPNNSIMYFHWLTPCILDYILWTQSIEYQCIIY